MDARPRPRAGALSSALVLWGVLHVGLVRATAPPPARPTGAPADVFSAVRAMGALERVLGPDLPHPAHPMGSPANDAVRERLVAELRGVGLFPEVHEAVVVDPALGVGGTVRNVTAHVAGPAQGAGLWLVAHYDSVPAGPGAGDDLSGVATLVETARALRAGPEPRLPVRLLVTDGEEMGLLGARAFVARDADAARMAFVINVEARGTDGPSRLFQTSADARWLIERYARAVARPSATSVSAEVYRRMPRDTDLSVFLRAGIEGANFAFIGGGERYHTPRDSLEFLDPASVQHAGDQVLALARAVARGLPSGSERGGEAVYADVAGRWLLHWPAPWSVAAAVGLACAGTWAAWRALRGAGGRGWRGVPLASLALALVPALAAAFAHGAAWCAVRASADPAPWGAEPGAMRAVVAASVVAALTLAPGRSAAAAAAVTAVAWSALGLALAARLPGATALVFLPLAGLALGGAMLGPRAGAAAGLVLAGLVHAPLVAGLEDAFGLARADLLAFALGLEGTLLLACVAGAPRVERRALAAGALAVAVGGIVLTARPPYHDAARPFPLDLGYHLDADAGVARWIARSHGAALPEALAERGFRRDPSGLWSRDAPRLSARVPRLEVESEGLGDGGERRLRLRLLSPAGAATTRVRFERGSLVAAAGQPLEPRVSELTWIAVPPEGVELEIEVDGPLVAVLEDFDFGLPAEGVDLAEARPVERVPWGSGDRTVVRTRARL